jgi:hypothetical protein
MIDHYSLTLDGSAQQVSDVLPAATRERDDVPALSIQFEIQEDDTNAAFIGGDDTVSATEYGVRVPPIRAAEPLTEPRIFRGVKLRLREFWITGTAADVVHILVVRA